MSDLTDYVRRLVDIPSVTGSEHALAAFLEQDLRERGFSAILQDVVAGRQNVYAVSPGVLPRVVFCTHLDTVPPFYPSSEDEEHIYGRGSCDAKGILAAMVFAARALREAGIHEVGLLLVVGEEVDNMGAITANHLESRSRYVVVGEPDEGALRIFYYASKLFFFGREKSKEIPLTEPAMPAHFGAQMRSFAQRLLRGEDPEASGEDGLNALQVVLAAYESFATNRVVELE